MWPQGHTSLFTQDSDPLVSPPSPFLIAMATNGKAPRYPQPTPPLLCVEDDAVRLLLSLPLRRQEGKIFVISELKQIAYLLGDFDKSTKLRSAPSKQQLTVAVNALLPPNCKAVSVRWRKPQLVEVVQRWISEALVLVPFDLQAKLFVEVKPVKGKRKLINLDEAIFVEEQDGSVSVFSIYSPQKGPKPEIPLSQPDPVPQISPDVQSVIPQSDPFGTPDSGVTSASSFARQLRCVGDDSPNLAPVGVIDPGVDLTGDRENSRPPAAIEANEGLDWQWRQCNSCKSVSTPDLIPPLPKFRPA